MHSCVTDSFGFLTAWKDLKKNRQSCACAQISRTLSRQSIHFQPDRRKPISEITRSKMPGEKKQLSLHRTWSLQSFQKFVLSVPQFSFNIWPLHHRDVAISLNEIRATRWVLDVSEWFKKNKNLDISLRGRVLSFCYYIVRVMWGGMITSLCWVVLSAIIIRADFKWVYCLNSVDKSSLLVQTLIIHLHC